MGSRPAAEDLSQKITALEKENAELKRRESELRDSNAKYRQMMETLNEVIYTLDRNAMVTFISPNIEKISGYLPEEIVGRKYTDFVYPDDMAQRSENFQKILNGEQVATEYRYVKKDGNPVWVMTSGRPVFQADELVGIQGMLVNIDERKRAEENLRESEHRYRTLFERNLNPIAVIDKQGRYLDANPAFLKFVETSGETLLQKNIFDFWPYGKNHVLTEAHRALWETGGTLETEYLINGETKILELTISPIDFQGVDAVIGVGKDVTEQKKAREALIRSERKWRNILVNTPQIAISLNPEGQITFANEHFLQLTGWEAHEVIGRDWFDLLIPEHIREELRGVFRTVMKERDIREFSTYENEIVTKSGELRSIAWSNVVNKDAQGDVIDITCLGLDLTERKKADATIRDSEEKYRTILESMEDGYFEVDIAGNFTFFNEAMRKMLGYTEDALMGMNNREFMDNENAGKVYETFNHVYQTGKSYKAFDWELIRKDGAISNIDTSVSLIRDEKGRAVGFRGIARDFTEKKIAQEEKAQLEEQINQAQKLESVGRLAGGVAHDLNNLLSPILGYSEILLEGIGDNDWCRRELEQILKAGQRARDLVQQLLAFSRKQLLEFKNVDLNALLKNFYKLLRHTIRENIDINMQLAQSLPFVKSDSGQLEQVVMNLAVNAQDAMPKGGKMMIETAGVELDESYAAEHTSVVPGSYVRLTVTDTGCGMDEETLEKIFEPFFTTKGVGKGTGLGLATVYGIVKQHGGNVWVYAEPGLGSTFKIYLPVSADELEAEAEDTSAIPSDMRGSETILLVEDNHQVRALSLDVLEEKGYTVLTAENGLDAIELLNAHDGPIDLLLTDVIMPEMDGRQLFERVSGMYPNAGVIYMSGYTVDVIAHHGVIDTGVNFLQKPFAIKDLAAKVREVLDK